MLSLYKSSKAREKGGISQQVSDQCEAHLPSPTCQLPLIAGKRGVVGRLPAAHGPSGDPSGTASARREPRNIVVVGMSGYATDERPAPPRARGRAARADPAADDDAPKGEPVLIPEAEQANDEANDETDNDVSTQEHAEVSAEETAAQPAPDEAGLEVAVEADSEREGAPSPPVS